MESNETLARRIVELTNELSTKNQECLALQAKVEQICSTVELQRTALDSLLNRFDLSNIPEKERIYLFSLTDPDPAQCLSERDAEVAAKAVEKFAEVEFFGYTVEAASLRSRAISYANQIRQQAKDKL